MAFGMMFFRARSLESVNDMLTQIFTNFHPEIAPQFIEGYLLIVIIMAAGYLLHFMPSRWGDSLQRGYTALPLLLQAIILAIVLLVIIQVRQSDIVPFIYLQY